MVNTHGKTSMEEFAAKALPELEALLKHFKQTNRTEEPDDANATQEPDEDTGTTDKERIEELAHIIWHLAGQIEDIAYHGDKDNVWVISRSHDLRRQLVYIKGYLHGELHDENSEVGNF